MNVFLLWHVRELPDGDEDTRLIGVYASAEAARRCVAAQPGFRDRPEGFQVDRYAVGQDHWTEGYVTVAPEAWPHQLGERPS